MCGRPKTPKVRPSAAEIQNARNAVDKFNERREDGYLGLEAAAIADAGANHKEPLRGIGSAEMARQEAQAFGMANVGRKAMDFASVGDSVGQSRSALDVDSGLHAQVIRDQKMMGAIQTGQDKANNSAGAMMSAAANGLSSSLSQVQAQMTKQQAKYQAMGDVAGSAMAAGAHRAARGGYGQRDLSNALVGGGEYDKNGLWVDTSIYGKKSLLDSVFGG